MKQTTVDKKKKMNIFL